MQDEVTILKYTGFFSFETIGVLLNNLKNETEKRGISTMVYKKILSVMIEALENVFKYNEFYEFEESLFPEYYPSFSLVNNNNYFILTTGNPILNSDKQLLSKHIDMINNLDREGLRKLFRSTLSNGKFSNKGGAGLGFIEMAKVTGEHIKYDFKQINNKFSYYTFSVFIPFSAS